MCRQMDLPTDFSLLVITADKQKNSGGEELYIPKAWKHTSVNHKQQVALEKAQKQESIFRRNPNHYDNSTRNIKLPNGEIRKIHIRLVRKFNNKTVL
jgi:hypothetical protein